LPDREIVLNELNAILSSHHFKNSKRYPALLKYVVQKTLDGHSAELKERTLGVEVFDRPPDYDTNADPVVRFSAGEVRKRIAQFYHESDAGSRLQIDLPLGSYVPEFTLCRPGPAAGEGASAEAVPAAEVPVAPSPASSETWSFRQAFRGGLQGTARSRFLLRVALPVTVAALLAGGYVLDRMHAASVPDRIWKPLLASPGSVEIVIGDGVHEVRDPPDAAHEILATQLHGAYNRVSVCDAVAVSRLAAVLGNHSKAYEVKEADLTSLQDIRDRSVILIGAYNNRWTMRLIEPLRFHFVKDGHSVRIVDARDPQNSNWAVDYTKSISTAIYDYAIIARYHDSTTNGGTLIIAGIGAYGTEAASEAIAAPHSIDRLLASVPKGSEDRNLELVIKTTIIDGEAGPADVVSANTW
jgi:hypothetical protein